MTETLRYSQLGKEDIRFGTGTFKVTLADGSVVTLNEVDVAALLSTASLSTQTVTVTHSSANNAGYRFIDPNGTLLHSVGPGT